MAFIGLGACAPKPLLRQEPTQAAALGERKLTPEDAAALRERIQIAPLSSEAAQAKYFLAGDMAARGDWKAAGEQWQKVVKEHPASGWDRLAQYKTAVALEALGDPARAFVQYQAQLSGTAVADLPERSRAACLRLAADMEIEPLRQLIAYPVIDEFQGVLRARVLEMDFAEQRMDLFNQGLDEFRRLYPFAPQMERVEALAKKVEALVPVEPRKLGLIVPMSGPLSDFGVQVKRGIDLAFAQVNAKLPEAERFQLIVVDEAGTSPTAVQGLKTLVETEHVIGVLGPLGSDTTALALPYLNQQRIPMLSSTASRPDLANASPWFFRNCLTPEKQGAGMADHAMLDMRLTRVATLASDRAYGQTLAQAFAARFQELGGTVVVQVSYTAGTNDFREYMDPLGGIDPAEGKNAEQNEKREQTARVEEGSTSLGRFLLEQAPKQVLPEGVTTTPPLKVMVVDLAEDAASKELNAGRAFSDRFARTLGQLPELEILAPTIAEKALRDRHLSPDMLTPLQLAELGKLTGAAYVLGGGVVEVPADPTAWEAAIALGGADARAARREMARYQKARWYNVAVQIIDPLTAEVVSTRRFQFSKYKAPASNPLGLQAIYLPASAIDVGQVVPSLRFFDLNVPLLGSDLWDLPDLDRHLPNLEGARFSTGFWPDSKRSVVRAFTQGYKETYASKPGLLAAQSYDAAQLMLNALKRGAADRTSLREALARAELDGVSGRTVFDRRQDAHKRLPLIEVKDGQLKEIEP